MASRPPAAFISLGRFTAPLRASLSPWRLPASCRSVYSPVKLSARAASQWGRNQRPSYSRFSRAQSLYALWYTSPAFRNGLGAAAVFGGIFYYSNLEYVPVSGRRRFNFISPKQEAALAQSQYQAVMQEYGDRFLPPSHPYSVAVYRVVSRLVPHSGLDQNWEVRVIDDDDQMNAFVMPGGKIFVFSGILPISGGEDGLAHVIGHEIGHTVAHHTAEKLSKSGFIFALGLILAETTGVSGGLVQDIVDIALNRTNSRTQESEADHIGMLMASKACYDPQAAIELWKRFTKAEQHTTPQFLSTHPASKNRVVGLQGWLPEAKDVQTKTDCASTMRSFSDFSDAFRRPNPGLAQQAQSHDDDFF